MRLIGNIIWIIFGGIVICTEYMMAGIALCLTVIGIPFGIQCFKLGLMALFPFGQKAVRKDRMHGVLYFIMNILWLIIGGIPIMLTHFFFAILFAITIVGIPFARQHIKLMKLAFSPFGRDIITN